ncbi:calcium-binding protein [Actinoplanes sp. NPDC051851]|uniref:calcium-binding protein n=1 Tax=Actinoplanes sp. NPDC051851 TaxID=3154753 RepID=UPI00342F60E5
MSRSIRPARAGVALLTPLILGTLAAPAPAHAATSGVVKVVTDALGTRVQYVAAAGKNNLVSITRSGAKVAVSDVVPLTPGKGCKLVKGSGTRVLCSTSRSWAGVRVTLGAGNDSVINQTGLRMSADGGDGNDYLTGGSNADDLVGGDGVDYLSGRLGNDTLSGSAGNDRVYGGPGNDSLYGQDGKDLIYGGDGNDTLRGSTGDDRLTGDTGNDDLDGGAGDDWHSGGSGNDRFPAPWTAGPDADYYGGGSGWDTISYATRTTDVTIALDGMLGNDDGADGEHDTVGSDVEGLTGGHGADRITGTDNAETIHGGGGDDVIDARGGDDVIVGEDGADVIDAGAGDDRVTGDGHRYATPATWPDTLHGGPGVDTLSYGEGAESISVDLNGSAAGSALNEGDIVDDAFENAEATVVSGPAVFTGNAAGNVFLGGGKGTTMYGRSGNDTLTTWDGGAKLYGEEGDDTLVVRKAGVQAVDANLLDGGADSDTCVTPWPDRDTLTACEH